MMARREPANGTNPIERSSRRQSPRHDDPILAFALLVCALLWFPSAELEIILGQFLGLPTYLRASALIVLVPSAISAVLLALLVTWTLARTRRRRTRSDAILSGAAIVLGPIDPRNGRRALERPRHPRLAYFHTAKRTRAHKPVGGNGARPSGHGCCRGGHRGAS
jgi:hypothetical protein